jgi:hypothetical protein
MPGADRFLADVATLVAVSRHLHAARTLQCIAAFEAGTITKEQSIDAMRITRVIARTWAVTLRTGRAPFDLWAGDRGGAWDYERIKTLQAFARVARANVDAAPGDAELLGLADAIDALIHHEADYPTARVLLTADVALPSLSALPVDLPPVPAGALEADAQRTRPAAPEQSVFQGAEAA